MSTGENPIVAIDWSKEPQDDRERRIRLAVIRRAEERFSSEFFKEDHWMKLSALQELAVGAETIASDLADAIANRRVLRDAQSKLKRARTNDELVRLALADVAAEDCATQG
jgi:hypothetical protein